MKRIIQSLVLAALISAAQASPFLAGADDDLGLPAGSTRADRFVGEADVQTRSAIPAGANDQLGLARV